MKSKCVGSVKGTDNYPLSGGGVIPTPTLHFSRTSLADVKQFIKDHHYSHTHPGGIDYCFRLDWNGKLAGACVFGYMAGNPKAMCVLNGFDEPKLYRELMRLVLLDEVPRNSESRFIAWCLRYLRDEGNLLAILSFADPKYGHQGTVYKASNWIYTGLQKQDRPRLIIDGTEVHPRMCVNRYGTSSIPKLEAMGLSVVQEPREPKHRYVYILHPEYSLTLKYPQQPYVG